MKLTLIQSRAMHSVALPEKISGQYFVEFTNIKGKSERLLSVSPCGGKWQLECGKNAYIINTKKDDSTRSYIIDGERSCLEVHIKNTVENALLLIEDDSQEMSVFKKYAVKGKITIGKMGNNHIVINSSLASDYCAEIVSEEHYMTYKELSRSARTFINGEKVSEKKLMPGDSINILGYTIIIGRMIIAINKGPALQVNTGTAITDYIRDTANRAPVESYFDDIKDDSMFYVSPRFVSEPENEIIEIQGPPNRKDHGKQPVILSLGPSFTMGVASATTGAFTIINGIGNGTEMMRLLPTMVMSGSMLLSSMVWPVISKTYQNARSKKDEQNRKKVYMEYLNGIEDQIRAKAEKYKEQSLINNPDFEQLKQRIELQTCNLWERTKDDYDYLCACLGYGDVTPLITIKAKMPELEVDKDFLNDELKRVSGQKYDVSMAPITLSLRDEYILGIVGNRQRVIDYTKALIMQLTSLHSYATLKICLLYDESENEQWNYLRWLPHTWNETKDTRYVATTLDELKAVCSALNAKFLGEPSGENGKKNETDEHYVIVCASQSLASKTNLINDICELGSYRRFSVIALYDQTRNLPSQCHTVIRFCNEAEAVDRAGDVERCIALNGKDSPEVRYIYPYAAKDEDLRQAAVSQAVVRLGQLEGGYKLPDTLTFMEMMRVNSVDELNCLQRWKENNGINTIAAPIGVDSRGDILSLDMHQKAHGPHGLIAGTTGSGKSEFIMTMIISLAVNYSPEDVSFLLIDYKGGGMAEAFKKLPHVAGIITNLDGAAVTRSLISIRSELKRRQALFIETGEKLDTTISDIYRYQKLYHDGVIDKPLQHLFIISDEFAELKSQCPEFMDELISAARIGRSLGVHLILATQKPSGIVNDQIWSNSRFKICLKVQERADSMDVIRCNDAAEISQTGRFYMQVGYNELFELGQSAWAGANYKPDENVKDNVDDDIVIIDNVGRVIGEAENNLRKSLQKNNKVSTDKKSTEKKQLQAVTEYLVDLCDHEGIASDKLWLPPIPDIITTDEVIKKYDYTTDENIVTAVMGEYDVPQIQQQHILTVSAQEGNIVVYGSADAGKTSFVSNFIFDIIRRYPANRAVFYILDFASEALKAFEGYNAVGAVISSNQSDRIENLFNYIDREIEVRKEKLAAYDGDYYEYCKHCDDMPCIHIVITNFGAFTENYENYTDTIEVLSRDASKFGIVFLITALTTSGVKFRIAQNFSNIYMLNLIDNSYSNVFGSLGGMVPGKNKGRGLLKKEFVSEFQTAFIVNKGNPFDAIRNSAEVINSRCSFKAEPIRALPKVYTCEYALENYPMTDLQVPVAMSKKYVMPMYISLANRINAFVSNNTPMKNIAEAISGYVSHNMQTVVLDPDNRLLANTDGYKLYKGDDIATGILELFTIAKERFAKTLEAEAATGDPCDYSQDMIVCVIYGVSNAIKTIKALKENSADMLDKFNNLLLGGRLDFGIHFVIFDDTSGYGDVRSSDWLKKHIRQNKYVWIGSGLPNERWFTHKNFSDSKIDFGEDFGYLVSGNKQTLAKFMSTEEPDD